MPPLKSTAPLLAILYAVSLVAVTRGPNPTIVILGTLCLAHMFFLILNALRIALIFLIAIAIAVDVKPETIKIIREVDLE